MDVLRWNPFDDLRAIQDEVNRLFEQRAPVGRGVQRREPVSTRVWTPVVDVLEDQDEIVVRAELPGLKQEDIHIELTADSLSLTGERRLPDEDKKENYVRMERPYGRFQRSFSIGVPVKLDEVRASYTDGVLEVRLPKSEEIKPKKVEVSVGDSAKPAASAT